MPRRSAATSRKRSTRHCGGPWPRRPRRGRRRRSSSWPSCRARSRTSPPTRCPARSPRRRERAAVTRSRSTTPNRRASRRCPSTARPRQARRRERRDAACAPPRWRLCRRRRQARRASEPSCARMRALTRDDPRAGREAVAPRTSPTVAPRTSPTVAPATAPARARARPRRRLPVPVLIGAAAVPVAAVLGIVLGGSGSDKPTTLPAAPSSRTMSAGALKVAVPATWHDVAAKQPQGLALKDARAVAPRGAPAARRSRSDAPRAAARRSCPPRSCARCPPHRTVSP